MTPSDTIFALASGQGRAAVAIIRLSGPASRNALEALAGVIPPPRRATLATLRDPVNGAPLDRGLCLFFPAPHSFTGEDCAELQVHGGRAVVGSVLKALSGVPDCRLAEPGEFTRRAFLNGKLDLAAVEGLADLIDAETEAQRRQAFQQLEGHLGVWVEERRSALVGALALAEAAIDFTDEEDTGDQAATLAGLEAAKIAQAIRHELSRPQAGERIREGFVVTIAGPPNAGKSTLLNALARRDAAIVSPYAGTTRDPIEVDLDLGGFAVVLIDTAGIRDTSDLVEQEGVARARARAASADLVLWLQPAQEVPTPPLSDYARLWTIGTKADLAPPTPGFDALISVQTGLGVDGLLQRVRDLIGAELLGGETALVTRVRHRRALEQAVQALERAGQQVEPELLAEELRAANSALGQITGTIGVEDILGAIFARFCIGK